MLISTIATLRTMNASPMERIASLRREVTAASEAFRAGLMSAEGYEDIRDEATAAIGELIDAIMADSARRSF